MDEQNLTHEERLSFLENELSRLNKEIEKKDQIIEKQDKIIKEAEKKDQIIEEQDKIIKEIDTVVKEQDKIIQNQKIEYDKLEGEKHNQELAIEELLKIIENKEFQRVAQVLRSYGIKSEKSDVLVNEAEVINDTASNDEKKKASKVERTLKGKSSNKATPGRKKGTQNYQGFDLSKVPTRDEYVDSLDDVKCDTCGETMIESGQGKITKLVWHPGWLEVVNYYEKEYTCPNCDEKRYKEPVDIFDDNLVSPSFAANIINYKYNYALPLYRQEEIYARLGVPISRVSLSKYVLLSATALKPLFELMLNDLIATPAKVIQADETTFKCILDCKAEDRDKNYVFVYSTTYYDQRIRIYAYSENRSSDNPKEILKDFTGYLEVDGYDGYNNIPNVKVARCWVHARRKYADIVKSLKENQKANSTAFKLVKKINRLFKIEEECRRKKLTPEQILEVRKAKSLPIVDEYFTYIKSIKDDVSDPLLGAINYSLDLEDGLRMFLEDGHIPLDNNLSERTVKSFVIMRKNALFAYSKGGAVASCILMSIVQTAKENCLDVEKYLSYVLTKINTIKMSELKDLLPYSPNLPKDLKVKIR